MTQDHEPSMFPSAPAGPESAEASGRTVDEAIERALSSLGAQRSQVDIVVLDGGSRGVLGIGAREARVRLSRRSGGADEVGAVARDLLGLMGISADVSVEQRPEGIRVNVEGANVGGLIGKHGQTLEAVEALLALLVSRKAGGPVRIELDAEGYRERREASLQDLAKRTAERVARHGREIALTPMSPRDRRIIHVALQEHPRVSTVSRGEHAMRRVVVMPRGGRGGREQTSDENQVDSLEREPEGPAVGPGTPSGLPPRSDKRRSDRAAGSGRPRYQGRRTGEGRSSQRPPRFGRPERIPGRRDIPGQGPGKGVRPEGLPVEEEIEAEIEAYLARTSGEKKSDQNVPESPEESSKEEN